MHCLAVGRMNGMLESIASAREHYFWHARLSLASITGRRTRLHTHDEYCTYVVVAKYVATLLSLNHIHITSFYLRSRRQGLHNYIMLALCIQSLPQRVMFPLCLSVSRSLDSSPSTPCSSATWTRSWTSWVSRPSDSSPEKQGYEY